MRRREFITLLGGAAASLPLTARAQQSSEMRRIAVLASGNADDQGLKSALAAFQQRLQQLGWTDGQNLRIELRRGEGDEEKIRKYSGELAALEPDVILALGSSTVGQLLQATRVVPIVFVFVPDPVGSGFVNSLSRPGGNATGFMAFEYSLSAKWLELLKQIAPRAASGDPLGSWHTRRDWPVCRHPVRGAVARRGGEPHQFARRRAGFSGLRALRRWRPDRDRERFGGGSARFDRHTCGPTQSPGSLQLPRFCRGRRPDLLWGRSGQPVPARGRLCRSHPQGRETG